MGKKSTQMHKNYSFNKNIIEKEMKRVSDMVCRQFNLADGERGISDLWYLPVKLIDTIFQR